MKKRILMIDDDVALTQLVKFTFEATGDYEVCIENSALRGVETARRFEPHIILLDYIMPEMDGGELSMRLHDDPLLRRVPVIMVTAIVSSRDATNGLVERAGHLMMAKPVRFDILRHCIEQQLVIAA